MPLMVENTKLEQAKTDPSVLTATEISAIAGEVLRSRTFIKKTGLSSNTALPVAKNQKFFRELLAISSGTFATLTGISDYATLNKLETDFAIFYLYHQDYKYESWMDVWDAFLEYRRHNPETV